MGWFEDITGGTRLDNEKEAQELQATYNQQLLDLEEGRISSTSSPEVLKQERVKLYVFGFIVVVTLVFVFVAFFRR